MTLIVRAGPDTQSGFRVWLGAQPGEFDDQPTSLPGVYRFSYCNDEPESPRNRPE